MLEEERAKARLSPRARTRVGALCQRAPRTMHAAHAQIYSAFETLPSIARSCGSKTLIHLPCAQVREAQMHVAGLTKSFETVLTEMERRVPKT